MKKRLMAVLLAGAMVCSAAMPVAAADKKWTVATDTVFKPFEYTDEKGEFVGIDVDILAAIAEDQGFEYELKSLGWDASIAACQAKQADAMIVQMKEKRADGCSLTDIIMQPRA